MAKMNDQVPKARLGTGGLLKSRFPQNLPNDPTSKFQEFEIGSDLSLMQSKLKNM